jgi:tetratricopeptide (TPR) repeat protein
MSILDGMPSSEADLKKAMEFVAPHIDKMIAESGLTEREQSVFELMKEGLSLGDIYGITKEQRDALLVHAGRFLKAGDIQKARDILLKVYQFEPTDERAIYALATTFQLEGNFSAAGKLYLAFLALDATNPEGHLRLGECFLGAKEYDNAESEFRIARNFASSAGDAACIAHATKMLEIASDRRKAAKS